MKLTEDDITVDQHLGVVPNGLRVKIYVNNKTPIETGVKLRKQILENQEIVDGIRYIMEEWQQAKNKLSKDVLDSSATLVEHFIEGLIKDATGKSLKEFLGQETV